MRPLKAGFLRGSTKESEFPESHLPEVAFIGRSNVGKSSLLNYVVLDGSAAKVSSTPGKTQQINFFAVDSKWMFADLPGFGYAKVSKDERKKWSELVWTYLLKRPQLKLVCVLIDSRHDPQSIDLETIERLEHNAKEYLIVLTKIDKINETERTQRQQQIEHVVSLCKHCTGFVLFSTKERLGREHILGAIKRNLDH